MAVSDIPQRLYDREINFSISAFWDAGFRVQIGDYLNGIKAETTVDTYVEALEWLKRNTPETVSD